MSLSPLELRLSDILEKRRAALKLRILKSSPPGAVDFSSNDFLSLSSHPDFRRDYLKALNTHELNLGSTGSRLLDGNSTLAETLERDISAFHGSEAGLLTNSGFDANVSIFTCLPQPGDVIVHDELIHASVHDGMRQSRAEQLVSFRHNDVQDLRRVLTPFKGSGRNVFVAVESVYSMEGDLAPLADIVDILEELFPSKNAHLVVDEAHATGCYGPRGAGRVSELGLEKRVSVRLHTFGKSLACNGAIILCSPTIRLYLINYARPLIYTTFMSYPSLTAIQVAYDWLISGRADELANTLNSLISHLHAQLQTIPLAASPSPRINNKPSANPSFSPISSSNHKPLLALPSDKPQSPIFALLSSHPRELAAHCQAAGFIVRAVMPPTVPEGTERVRVCLHAGNTRNQIDRFVMCVGEWVLGQGRVLTTGDGVAIGDSEAVRLSLGAAGVVSAGMSKAAGVGTGLRLHAKL